MKRRVKICYVLAVLLGLGCFVSGCSRENWDLNAQENAKLSLNAYNVKDYKGAIIFADKALKNLPRRFSNENALETLYVKASAKYQLKQYTSARDAFQYIADKTDNTDLEIKTLDSLGEICFIQGDYKPAMQAFSKIADLITADKKPSGHSEFRRGIICQKWGDWKNADLHFQRVMFHFKDTDYAKLARQRVGGRYWGIEVGLYNSKDLAEKAGDKYKSLDMKTTIEPVIKDNTLKFRVLLGRFEKYAQAEKQLAYVQKKCPDAVLVVAK